MEVRGQMRHRLFKLLTLIILGLALPVATWLAIPQPQASAQCGTTASSCKTCHETQGKYPVKTKGEWHTRHAFGDFCTYCHGGNSRAADQPGAHTGLVKPLADVNVTCSVCHIDDCNTRAQKYASALGVSVGQDGGGQSPLLPGVFPRPAGPPVAKEPAALTGARAVNWGNVVLAALALALTFGGGGFVVWNERKIRLAQATGWEGLLRSRPELGELMPLLAQADSQTVKVIARTLTERSKN